MDFIQHREPCHLMASLQCRPVQCFQHGVDVGGVSISVENKAGHSSLHCLNSAGGVLNLSVEIPDGRGVHIINKIILEQRLDIIMYYMYTHIKMVKGVLCSVRTEKVINLHMYKNL